MTYVVEGYANNVLQNVNLKVEEGEFVSIMGPSGSGKSTLLYTISGMDGMTAGSVIFDGEDISKMNEKELTKLRLLKMGFIFQQMYMMKKLCIMDNIVLPGYQAKLRSRAEVNKKAEELLRRLGIVETAGREITEVSGGQLQRACLARALINSPKVLFADEPTGALARYALEHFSTAREAGEFLVGESGDFTWCNNLFLTDKEEAFCCENATEEVAAAGRARSVLRDAASELLEGLKWDNPDSLCVVNSFATKGNQDAFSGEPYNMNRWMKYRNYVREKEKFSLGDVKAIMAHEIVDQHEVANVHNSGTVHTVIVDYATGTIHVSFTKGMMAEDVPHFVDIGRY